MFALCILPEIYLLLSSSAAATPFFDVVHEQILTEVEATAALRSVDANFEAFLTMHWAKARRAGNLGGQRLRDRGTLRQVRARPTPSVLLVFVSFVVSVCHLA